MSPNYLIFKSNFNCLTKYVILFYDNKTVLNSSFTKSIYKIHFIIGPPRNLGMVTVVYSLYVILNAFILMFFYNSLR